MFTKMECLELLASTQHNGGYKQQRVTGFTSVSLGSRAGFRSLNLRDQAFGLKFVKMYHMNFSNVFRLMTEKLLEFKASFQRQGFDFLFTV